MPRAGASQSITKWITNKKKQREHWEHWAGCRRNSHGSVLKKTNEEKNPSTEITLA
jgi:hypothetical protein